MDLFTTPLFSGTEKARFLRRPNRFVIECDLEGLAVIAHLPNPGRLWELLLPGCTVSLVRNNPSAGRVTPYTAVAVERAGTPVLLHTQMTNTVVRFLLAERRLPGLEDWTVVRQEAPCGQSRFDFLLERGTERMFLEVKSCTLFSGKAAMFPDAITERGRRHLLHLTEISRQGFSCGVVFVVSSPTARFFLPDYHTDIAFAQTLLDCRKDLFVKAIGVHWQQDLTLGREICDIPIPWQFAGREARDRGCYILILNLPEDQTIAVGSLGNVSFPKGYYLYVGSAKKNLAKRMERHCRKRKNLFWHIDYLREVASSCIALPIRTGDDLEHELAAAVDRIAHWRIARFGSSDCRCETHLFGMREDPVHHRAFVEMLLHFRMDRLMVKPE